MKIKHYKIQFIKKLVPIYDEMEAESFFYLLLEDKRNLKRIDLALNNNLEFTALEIQNWDEITALLITEIPIQYIIGNTSFYGLDFEVNKNVLIPRPETEELVDWIIQENKTHSKLIKILDIGTGSGCIAISLAKNLPNAVVYAIDICENALDLAKKNAQKNNLIVAFTKKNILETEDLLDYFDIIVSNPPYVRHLEKAAIKKNVLENEPHLALFVENTDALIFYKKIAALALRNLTENGKLYFEINQYLAKETIELLEKMGFKNIELRQDIYGNDRMVKASINL